MKSVIISVFFLFTPTVFAGSINKIACSGAPKWVQFELTLNYKDKNFYGQGLENYANFALDCKNNVNLSTILCQSPIDYFGKKVSVTIIIDKDNIVTAEYSGIYNRTRIGCIARM